ncbi:MAG: glycosyltransferase [Planctomycetes bacterium]|nr:glycosyltransferase [Planctomycetota bacterium]
MAYPPLVIAALFDPDKLNQPALRWPLTIIYIANLLLITLYGLHRYWLVFLYYRTRRSIPRPASHFPELPRVTVQVPMFNEAAVARRVIDAACSLDYPADRLQVQVLDDSTDGCARLSRDRADYWTRRGIDVQYIHRDDRTGYKAGALENGLRHATGEFIAIFDADFVPRPNFLRRAVHYFTDPAIGMVQACWGHINRDESLLTRCQAIFLDGHFLIEHTARNRADRWINFNGTAGMWRRTAIEAAGGWQHDTLTEDVDLSYRAQLKGWRFVYLPRLICPAELPPEINAFKSQQHRWTKGSIQTAIKLLPTLLRADVPARVKVEAFFHLTSPMVYLYITLMVLLFFPAFYVNVQPFEHGTIPALLWGMTLFTLGTASAGVFYIASQRAQKRPTLSTILKMPVLMSLGIGIALNNARGVVEALLGQQSEFVRTPKYNAAADDAPADPAPSPASPDGHSPARERHRFLPSPSLKLWINLLELAFGGYMLLCVYLAFTHPGATVVSIPFLLLFAAGYLYVGISGLHTHLRAAPPSDPLPLPAIPS